MPDPLGDTLFPFDQEVNSRYVTIVPSIGSSVLPYDCGPSTPYVVHLADVDWSVRWIVENPVTGYSGNGISPVSIRIESSNPINREIEISIAGFDGEADIRVDIFDLSGRVIQRRTIPAGSSETGITIPVGSLPNGVYFAVLEGIDCEPAGFTVLK
jgi:hypothetical protein